MENDTPYMTGKKPFNFKLIGAGLIFLMDFNVNTIDFLPDFIGLILISAGIGKISYINEDFARAKKYINYYYAVAFIRFIWNVFYIVYDSRIFEAESQTVETTKILESNFMLLFVSVFSLVELILGVCVLISIFRGLEIFLHLSDRMVHTAKSSLVLLLLKIFFAFKFVLAALVIIPDILTEIDWDNLSAFFDTYLSADFVKNLLVMPCFIIQTLFGIFLLSLAIPYFYEISRDKDLYDFIKLKINGALINNPLLDIKKTLHSAFLFFTAGCVFFIDFQIDNINILPDFLICAFFLAGIFEVLKTNPEIKNTKLGIYTAINLFVSATAYITGTIYRIISYRSLAGEDTAMLKGLKISSDILFHISVIMLFIIFIGFYSFIQNLRRKHLEFSVRYLNKYISPAEKTFDKDKNKILKTAAVAFCVKTLSAIVPSGIFMFLHSLIIIAFAVIAVKWLHSIRDNVYSYYNSNKNFETEK